MKTHHKLLNLNATQLSNIIEAESVDLVVTSPPYPMIEMWDNLFSNLNPEISEILYSQPTLAFELMHKELDKVWLEVEKVLKPGGFVCINIGDATRTINSNFALYPNHTRIITAFQKLGMTNLPNIIWRKQTNAPNKFMGSGMLPAGAYVTLEHEWILIFRKGGKQQFKTSQEKLARQQSAYFWEERNIWFSDIWDLKGTKQNLVNSKSRERSAAYPFEIPYRLINMYSTKNSTILDPFNGTGTTQLASIIAGRNSIGIDIDKHFIELAIENLTKSPLQNLNEYIFNRIKNHIDFIENRKNDPKKSDIKHFNEFLQLPVITAQEKNLTLNYVNRIEKVESNAFKAFYSPITTSHWRNNLFN